VFLIPSTRDKLLPGLAEGRADIAAGNLTATEERAKLVDFVAADRNPLRELIVTGPASPPLATLDDLSGKTVHVRKASSYYESVVALNVRLRKERMAPVKIVELPDALEDEDALEMLAADLPDAVRMIVKKAMSRDKAERYPKAANLAEDLQRLEEIVRQLERDDGDLDRSLALFEEGVARLRAARERLGEAETRVKKVLEDAQGTLRTEDVDPGG